MKAVQLIASETLKLVDLVSRPLASHEIRIGVVASCVCGSDLKNIRKPVQLPQVPGHEFSGLVIEVSSDTDGKIKVGDRVTAFPMMGCLQCTECFKRNFRDCAEKKSLGFQLPGTFAEEVILDERFAVRLREDISFEQGALLEHLCCGFRLAKEVVSAHPKKSSQIVIIGDGPIALADIQALRAHGYDAITVIGKHPERLKTAKSLGATATLIGVPKTSHMDVCILAAPAEEVLAEMLGALNKGSTVYPQTRILNPSTLETMTAKGVSLGRAFAYDLKDFDEVMDWIKQGKITTDKLITTEVLLSDVPNQYQSFFEKKDHIKILIRTKRS